LTGGRWYKEIGRWDKNRFDLEARRRYETLAVRLVMWKNRMVSSDNV